MEHEAKKRAGGTTSQVPPPKRVKTEARAPVRKEEEKADDIFLDLADATCVAIIVPYRDLHAAQQRRAHLNRFVPHMHEFLGKLKREGRISDYHIYIVEQSNDGRKFNRGKLLNIGFDVARKSGRKHDVFIFHDVDLLPSDDLGAWYAKMPSKPIHIARVWDRYSNNKKYFGGVVSISKSDFLRLNGYPNTFWGWGGEDDELKNRLDRNGLTFDSPDAGTLTDLEGMDLQEKLGFLRQNKEWKCMTKWECLDEHQTTWKTNGMADLKYKVLSKEFIADTNEKASMIHTDVLLNGQHWSNEKSAVDYMPNQK